MTHLKGMHMRIAMAVAIGSVICASAQVLAAEPKTEDEKTLYAAGLALSRSLSTFNLTKAELEMVQAGLTDGALGNKPQVDLQIYGPKINQMQQTRVSASAEKEKKAGKAYLDKAASEKGAVKTASGLIYIPIKVGEGASPKDTDVVKVHYHGTLSNGNVFDSSVQRKEPASFPLNAVIKCWTEGVQKMKVGGKAKLICPSDIAYGDAGRPPMIPPGAALTFEVELLEIVKK
jgi:FKBP-type peptidyl-prolyl cis-trans isomerase FkpA